MGQSKQRITPGLRVGRWKTARRLGRGGNGEVWIGEDDSGNQVAIKFLMKAKKIAYARFRDEVHVLSRMIGQKGILPVLDSALPEHPGEQPPWYAMPLGVPVETWAQTATPRQKVLAIAQAAETMASLHELGLSHRDIKPANLVIFEDRCHVVDFGLVSYPAKSTLTGYREQIGPLWTMAPEVRRNGSRADPIFADVFSLAKTLWIILTQIDKGFDGQYSSASEVSIRPLFGSSYVSPLEDILMAATANNHLDRPSMRGFASRLNIWLGVSDSFLRSNPLQWKEASARLFPIGIPTQATWDDAAQIVAVLDFIGQVPSLNHMFYPSGGGNDLDKARLSPHEEGCIELITGICHLVRPINLTFEGFPEDPEWNYFRLETDGLAPSEVYDEATKPSSLFEVVTEIDVHTYAGYECWNGDRYDGKPLPQGARPVKRWFSGAFVMFQKTSFYNLAKGKLDAYLGRRNQMAAPIFRDHIDQLRALVKAKGIDLRSEKLKLRQASSPKSTKQIGLETVR